YAGFSLLDVDSEPVGRNARDPRGDTLLTLRVRVQRTLLQQRPSHGFGSQHVTLEVFDEPWVVDWDASEPRPQELFAGQLGVTELHGEFFEVVGLTGYAELVGLLVQPEPRFHLLRLFGLGSLTVPVAVFVGCRVNENRVNPRAEGSFFVRPLHRDI